MRWHYKLGCFTLCLAIIQGGYASTAAPKTSSNPHPAAVTHAKPFPKPTVNQASNPASLWTLISSNFRLPHYTEMPEVQRQIAWFQKNPQFFQRIAGQGQPYLFYIYNEVKKRNLPGELVLLPMIESAYDPFAYSWVGAAGLWQMMPATGANFGLKQDWWYDGRKDIVNSTSAALNYLTYLKVFFNGNWPLSIAAYNAGEGRVQSAVDRNARSGRGTSFWTLSLPAETASYVPRFFALAAIISNPAKYGIKLPVLKNGPQFSKIDLNHQIELSQAAKMAQISLNKLYELNPGYSRWATDPKGPYHILLPVNAVATFERNYNLSYGNRSLTSLNNLNKNAGQVTRQAIVTNPEIVTKPAFSKVGQNIVKAPTSTITPTTNSVASVTDTTAATPGKDIHYEVKTGDTLWNIAKRFNVSVAQIRVWNKLGDNDGVSVGRVLLLKPPTPQIQGIQYKVKAGDTLFSIAQGHGLHLIQIETANPQIPKDGLLAPGTIVNLPQGGKP